MWKSKINNPQDLLLFDAMKDIINGKKPKINYDELFFDSNKKLNPKRLNEIIPSLNYTLDQIVDHANEREKIGKPPSFHVGESMPYNSSMYKWKNCGNNDYFDNFGKSKNFQNNDYLKDNEKLYQITLQRGEIIVIKNLTQQNIHSKYIVIDGRGMKVRDIQQIQ